MRTYYIKSIKIHSLAALTKIKSTRFNKLKLYNTEDIKCICDDLKVIREGISQIAETLKGFAKEKVFFGDWISEKDTIEITGLSRSSLLKLRKNGKVTSSSFTGKELYYKKADFIKLLNKNETEM